MSNKSLLDQIINNHQAEEVAKLNVVEIVDNIFKELNRRESDILIRRFGLRGQGKETLEKIGQVHNLTRERIRQIETSSIERLRQLDNLNDYISGLKKVINQLLEEHGGLMEQEYLFNNLISYSVGDLKVKPEDEIIHKSYLDFLISKLLNEEFEKKNNLKHFKESFKLKYKTIDHLELLAEELLGCINRVKKVFVTEDLINLAKKLKNYQDNQDIFNTPNNLSISDIIGENFEENAELINANKTLYSVLRAARKIEQNKFGHWGVDDWREIIPKTINDKIYLVLKNHGEPLHFIEIADMINKIGFDHKKANAATVHNELILDNKYILVGRGLYGLKEWGYQKGTVLDIIKDILLKEGEPLSRQDIIDKVLQQRLVKKTTVNLALMNKDIFELIDGKYKLKNRAE